MNCPGLRANWSGTEERVIHVPPVDGLASFSRKKCNASNGTSTQAMRKEITRRAGIVSDKALKKAPVTPDKKASGTKRMIVVADEPNRRLNETEIRKVGGATNSSAGS
jgi:soluble cytochrome b562